MAQAPASVLQLGVGIPEWGGGDRACDARGGACPGARGGDGHAEGGLLPMPLTSWRGRLSWTSWGPRCQGCCRGWHRARRCGGAAAVQPHHHPQHARGVQQGDPWTPFLFSLALDALALDIRRHHPQLLMAWCLDVVTGPPADLADVLRLIGEREVPDLGLHLNMAKCEVCGARTRTRTRTWTWTSRPYHPASFACGRGMGSSSWAPGLAVQGARTGVAGKRMAKVEAILERVHTLDRSQGELTLIRAFMGFPKLAHPLPHPARPSPISAAIQAYDHGPSTRLSPSSSPQRQSRTLPPAWRWGSPRAGWASPWPRSMRDLHTWHPLPCHHYLFSAS
jgi:hypothetical protein